MKIIQTAIYKSPVKLKEPFVTSLGPCDHAENIIVVIRTDAGITGFGECCPYMPINGENMETCFIVGQYLAKTLHEKDPLQIEACTLLMDKVIYANTSIKSAFDIALYDIAAQHAGLPLYAFLSGKKNKVIMTDYTVSIGDADKMAADAKKIMANGFQVIKVKLGESKEKDVERILRIREAVGQSIPIRIDANQGWNTTEAIETLNALEPCNIQFCEEPIPRWNYMEMSKVKMQSNIPVMADESCCDHHDAKRLIDLSACTHFNVKLGKSSGIFKAKKIIELAEKAGIKMQIGGFLESRLGFTASAHLALISDYVLYYDFDTPLMFTEDPVSGGITYDEKGIVTVPDEPGLGAWFDEKYLGLLTKVIIN